MESTILSRYPDVKREIERLALRSANEELTPSAELAKVPGFDGFEEFQAKSNWRIWEMERESEFFMIH